MAFEERSTTQSKNQFSARIMSRKTDNMVCWAHLTDDTARKLFGVKSVMEIPYAAAAEKLPMLLDNDRIYVAITDMTAELTVVDPENF